MYTHFRFVKETDMHLCFFNSDIQYQVDIGEGVARYFIYAKNGTIALTVCLCYISPSNRNLARVSSYSVLIFL